MKKTENWFYFEKTFRKLPFIYSSLDTQTACCVSVTVVDILVLAGGKAEKLFLLAGHFQPERDCCFLFFFKERSSPTNPSAQTQTWRLPPPTTSDESACDEESGLKNFRKYFFSSSLF